MWVGWVRLEDGPNGGNGIPADIPNPGGTGGDGEGSTPDTFDAELTLSGWMRPVGPMAGGFGGARDEGTTMPMRDWTSRGFNGVGLKHGVPSLD